MRLKKDSHLAILKRQTNSYKGQNGLVLVIGGSLDYVGAPALSALAALRAGSDIVRLAAPEKAALAINALSPDLITVKLSGNHISRSHMHALVGLAQKSDAVLIGPGLAITDRAFVNALLKKISSMNMPLVVDADALKLADISSLKNCIITPHRKEFELFLRNNKRKGLIDSLAAPVSDAKKVMMIREGLADFFEGNNVLLLKGPHDLVISDNEYLVSKGGNPGMTVGGTGDILAGLCVGYLSQTHEPFLSASLASVNCKRIGDLLFHKSNFGFGFIASDFLKEIKRLKR